MSTAPHPTAAPAPELASPVPSPCVSLCKMDPYSGFCVGCRRTIDEIVQWSKAGDDFKRAVWAQLSQREVELDAD